MCDGDFLENLVCIASQVARLVARFPITEWNRVGKLHWSDGSDSALSMANSIVVGNCGIKLSRDSCVGVTAQERGEHFGHVLEYPEMTCVGDECGTAVWKLLSQIAAA
jgi:hypothetical protein